MTRSFEVAFRNQAQRYQTCASVASHDFESIDKARQLMASLENTRHETGSPLLTKSVGKVLVARCSVCKGLR